MKSVTYQYHLNIHFDAPIRGHSFKLHCIPQTDERQQILSCRYSVIPGDFISESRDQWGNEQLYGRCREEHSDFEVLVSGEALLGANASVSAISREQDRVFIYPTALTAGSPELDVFADSLRGPGNLETAQAAMTAIHNTIRYIPGATDVSTSAANAFSAGYGVCQDHAHIMLAVLRRHRIPCRYVAGMLMGEGKSHAWVEVLHEGRWYAYDPTNALVVSDQHIKFSHGRDALDCTINRGIFRGAANQTTEVSVLVTENSGDQPVQSQG